MKNSEQKAKELVYKIWKTPQYNDEMISMFTAKILVDELVDEILANIDATILYHKDSIALPINKQYWEEVKMSIKNIKQCFLLTLTAMCSAVVKTCTNFNKQ